MNKHRPNILFAIADDASHFGCFGHSFVRTPNIDSVAERGILFENAFTSNPKCAPARASILAGRHTWQMDAACNHMCYWTPGFKFIPDYMEDAGYFAGYTGKGWAPGNYLCAGYTRNPAGDEFNRFKLTPPEGTAIRKYDYARNFEDFLDQRPEGKPFWFWFGCREPHRPYNFGEGKCMGKSDDHITACDIPPYFPDTPEVRQDLLDYAGEIEWFDLHLGKMLDMLRDRGELENTIVIVTSDNGCPFPRVKGQMYEQDFHMPMVAMWLGSGIRGGRRVSDLIGFVDIAPTCLDIAGMEKPEQMWGKSFLDIFLTENEGRIDPSRNRAYFGREKHDVGSEGDLGYPVRCLRDDRYLYIRNFAPDRWPAGNPETNFTNCDGSPTKNKILELHRAGDDKYFNLAFGKRPAVELYDIVNDPPCMNNLAGKPEMASVLEAMDSELMSFLAKSGDPRLDDPDYFDRMPQTSDGAPYSWRSLMAGTFDKQSF